MTLDWFHAAVLGMIEGLTEFLPISSTFHLIFAGRILGLEQTEFLKMFEVAIQSGAIIAVLALYGSELLKNRKLILLVAASFVPTALVGLGLHEIIKGVFFESSALMLAAFMVVGTVFIGYEWWLRSRGSNLNRDLSDLTWTNAAIIGLAQAAAVLPGISRAGAVILAMMFLRVRRAEAAKYSFILALPTIGAAGLLDLLKFDGLGSFGSNEWSLLAIGMASSFITALIVLRWFIRFVQQHTLSGFGWYRLVAGALLVIFN